MKRKSSTALSEKWYIVHAYSNKGKETEEAITCFELKISLYFNF